MTRGSASAIAGRGAAAVASRPSGRVDRSKTGNRRLYADATLTVLASVGGSTASPSEQLVSLVHGVLFLPGIRADLDGGRPCARRASAERERPSPTRREDSVLDGNALIRTADQRARIVESESFRNRTRDPPGYRSRRPAAVPRARFSGQGRCSFVITARMTASGRARRVEKLDTTGDLTHTVAPATGTRDSWRRTFDRDSAPRAARCRSAARRGAAIAGPCPTRCSPRA